MRRLAPLVVVAIVAGCAGQAPRPVSAECVSGCAEIPRAAAAADAAPTPFVVQQMPVAMFAAMDHAADSTTATSFQLIQSVDVAVTNAVYASRSKSVADSRPAVREARVAMQSAGKEAAEAIRQGDKLNSIVTAMPTAVNRPWNNGPQYNHYWTKARHELVLARNSAGQAVDAADAALACGTLVCQKPQVATLKQQAEATSAATYQAAPLVRIAMVYATSKFAIGL